ARHKACDEVEGSRFKVQGSQSSIPPGVVASANHDPSATLNPNVTPLSINLATKPATHCNKTSLIDFRPCHPHDKHDMGSRAKGRLPIAKCRLLIDSLRPPRPGDGFDHG